MRYIIFIRSKKFGDTFTGELFLISQTKRSCFPAYAGKVGFVSVWQAVTGRKIENMENMVVSTHSKCGAVGDGCKRIQT